MGIAVHHPSLTLAVQLDHIAGGVPGRNALHPQQHNPGGGEVDTVPLPLRQEVLHKVLPRLHSRSVQIVGRQLGQQCRRSGSGSHRSTQAGGHPRSRGLGLPGKQLQQGLQDLPQPAGYGQIPVCGPQPVDILEIGPGVRQAGETVLWSAGAVGDLILLCAGHIQEVRTVLRRLDNHNRVGEPSALVQSSSVYEPIGVVPGPPELGGLDGHRIRRNLRRGLGGETPGAVPHRLPALPAVSGVAVHGPAQKIDPARRVRLIRVQTHDLLALEAPWSRGL